MPSTLLSSNRLWAKVLRFALVGGLSTMAYGIITVLAVESARISPLSATVLGYLLVVPLNFVLQRRFTFRSTNSKPKELPRFLLVHGLNILGSSLIMFIVTDVGRYNYLWGVVLTMVMVPLLLFIVMDRWVFGRSQQHLSR